MNDIDIGDHVQVIRIGFTGMVIDIDSDGDICVGRRRHRDRPRQVGRRLVRLQRPNPAAMSQHIEINEVFALRMTYPVTAEDPAENRIIGLLNAAIAIQARSAL